MDTVIAAVQVTAIVPPIVIDTMATIMTADIQTIDTTMIAIKVFAAAATTTIVTSDHGIKAIGMCPISIHSIGCVGTIIFIGLISVRVCIGAVKTIKLNRISV